MKGNFDASLKLILKHEGRWSNHLLDPGGCTNFGITLRTYRRFKSDATKNDLVLIPMKDVRKIYRAYYWDAIRGDELPPGVDLMVFDAAVNQGSHWAAKFLQRACEATDDGDIGPKTLAAVRAQNPHKLITETAARRMRYYGGLSLFKTFGLGWSRRLMDVTAESLKSTLEK